MEKFYLTTPIYYVNAKPHIGHAYTTLAADIIARYWKQKFNNPSQPPLRKGRGTSSVFFLTGTDEHGAHIAEAATKEGKKPKAFCDAMIRLFKDTWTRLNIEYTHFIRTTDSYHEKGAQEFLTKLKKNGDVYKGDYIGLYCNNCESFITEKELDEKGNCPHHKKPPQKISEKNWFFKLEKYLKQIQELIEIKKLKIQPEERLQEVLGLFKQNITDFSISRPSVTWGVPLPWNTKQTIYVWVEALLNYWTGVQKNDITDGSVPLSQFWPPNLQIIGKDIIKFHCIYWPAMLLSYYDGNTEKLPNKIFVHGFFTVNGEKMSKTIGNVIDPNGIIDKYGVDAARYLIISQFPFGTDGDIEESKFTEKYNADLANGIGNLVSRVTTLCLKQITDWNGFWKKITNYELRIMDYETLMENLQLYEALRLVLKEVRECDEYLAQKQPWKLDKEKKQEEIISILSMLCARILLIARQLSSFLPQTTASITQRIDQNNKCITVKDALFPRLYS